MFNEGDIVDYHTWNDQDQEVAIRCRVMSTFYEPGDPVQGVNLQEVVTNAPHGGLYGRRYGGVDASWCTLIQSAQYTLTV
jgi:hypothetical protein